MAETTKKTTSSTKKAQATSSENTAPSAKGTKTFSEEEVKAMVAAAVADAINNVKAELKKTGSFEEDTVTVMFIAEVSPENTLVIPEYGSLNPTSSLDIPKKEFKGKFMTPLVRKLIAKRHLIVLNGLTEDERVRYNCNYKEGEVMDEQTFDKILDFDDEKLAYIFADLCDEHKKFVCRRIITAYEKGDNRLPIEKLKKINDLSKGVDPKGLLKPIIEAYGKSLA